MQDIVHFNPKHLRFLELFVGYHMFFLLVFTYAASNINFTHVTTTYLVSTLTGATIEFCCWLVLFDVPYSMHENGFFTCVFADAPSNDPYVQMLYHIQHTQMASPLCVCDDAPPEHSFQ